MSSEVCKGCRETVHDVAEHIEASASCRTAYPEETKALERLGIIGWADTGDETFLDW